MANFKDAFAAARKAGKSKFTWNGKSYTTELRSDAAPKTSARPTAKPSTKKPAVSGNKATAAIAEGAKRTRTTPNKPVTPNPSAKGAPDTSARPKRKPMDMKGIMLKTKAAEKNAAAKAKK